MLSYYADEVYPSDIKDIQSDFIEAFSKGARWRIDVAWHSTDEFPERSGYLVALMDNGLMETMYYNVGIGFSEMQLKGYVSWAYVEDLMPEAGKKDGR